MALARKMLRYRYRADALTANPDVNIIFGINDDSALGGLQSYIAAGLDTDNLLVVGFGCEGIACKDALQEGGPYKVSAAIGVTMLMLAGEFDLSIGSMLAVTGITTVVVFNATDNVWLGIIAGLATGPIVGSIHGYLVTQQRMNSLVTTLGSLFALRGWSTFIPIRHRLSMKTAFMISRMPTTTI